MRDRVLLQKAVALARCVTRVREEYHGHEAVFDTDFTRQDAAILNLIRACEQVLDMANRMIRVQGYEPASDAKEAFLILHRRGHIDRALAQAMQSMIGFRNIAVHEYQALDLAKVRAIIEHRLDDLLAFSKAMLQADPAR